MSASGNFRDKLSEALKGHQADCLEIHWETAESTVLRFRGKEMEEVSRLSSSGGNVRAQVKGGWGFMSFNEPDDLRRKVDLAVEQATWVGKEKSYLASKEPIIDIVPDVSGADLATEVPLSKKKELLDGYNDIIMSTPGMKTSIVGYGDGLRHKFFADLPGSYIEQNRRDVPLRLAAVASKNGEVQQSGTSLGTNGPFSPITGLENRAKELAGFAVALLAAPQAKAGEYTVVLDPILAGVFAHEAFGHLSESDFVYENDRMREIMVLGRKFGGRHLNIVDGAAIPGLRGSYKYDDEGVRATKTYLIKEGVLTGRLHSRETAAKMGEPVTGNARAVDYRFPPIVRMTNTIIEPGKMSFDEIIGDIKEGIYAKNWYGGTTSMEMFTFSPGEAYMIRNGKVAEMVRPAVLSGNVFSTLEHIDAVGNDLDVNQGGGCGKAEQYPLPVSNGSPHIRIQHCLVGGR